MKEAPGPADARDRAACLNCGATLAGQYCGQCGQRARDRLISLWQLLRDAFGDLFELDSRLWRTLIPLMVRPGRLTSEYLRGRRVHFMPPFRTYLVLSLVFFLVAFFDPQRGFGLLFEPAATEGTESDAPASANKPGEQAATDGGADTSSGANCTVSEEDLSDLPAWLEGRLTRERLEELCERLDADDERSILDSLSDNVPVGLYVLLPLLALVLKLLYPLSKRYYVEHLLFLVHFHAFLFLALCLQLVVSQIGALLPTAGNFILSMLIPLYVPVYLYKAQRRVYGQGHLPTALKYVALVIAYIVSFVMMLGIVGLIAVLSF